jgi:hypothetical protein
MSYKILFLILFASLSALVPTSCSSSGSSDTEALLSAAGFSVKIPSNDQEKAIYDQLPAYQVQRGTYKGKIFYAFKDEGQGVAFVGTEPEYQKYQELAIKKRIARDHVRATQMEQDMAYRWYGAYGYHYRRFH